MTIGNIIAELEIWQRLYAENRYTKNDVMESVCKREIEKRHQQLADLGIVVEYLEESERAA